MGYRIIFAGEVLPGHDVSAVKQQFIEQAKLSPERADRLFSGKPVTIKRDLDEVAARNYMETMEKSGVVVVVDPPLPDMEETLLLEPAQEQDDEKTQLLSPKPPKTQSPES
jgi:uncharacterized protein YlzI (FlbEa/FlbD family)